MAGTSLHTLPLDPTERVSILIDLHSFFELIIVTFTLPQLKEIILFHTAFFCGSLFTFSFK